MSNPINAPVITGFGVVSPNGIGDEAFARAVAQGRCGIGEIVSFDPDRTGRERAAECVEFDAAPFLRSPKNYLDRNSALAFAACEMAVRQSGATLPNEAQECGIALGSAAGNIESTALFYARLVKRGPRLAPPFLFPHTYHNTSLGLLCIEYGLGGPHACFSSGGVAGLEAVGFAAECIARGRTDFMLGGGVEAFHELIFRAALKEGWLSPVDGGEESCRPFSKDGNGTILGEGAAVFAVESEAGVRARAAKVLGRITGFGVGASAKAAMTKALAATGEQKENVAAVFAAASGLPTGDQEEAAAIAGIFGDLAVPVTAFKSLVGETLGASGAINLAAALIAMKINVLPQLCGGGAGAFAALDLVTGSRSMPKGMLLVNASHPGCGRWVSMAVVGDNS
jgi:3-oxoacyl-(acyl-carrier-protein) synthase